ncbi:MAG TPA: polyketide synthase dehydratase domain-containing protein, partial [Oscillatoriaceae cyanobacterium]
FELRSDDERQTLHATATVLLTARLPNAPEAPAPLELAPYARSVESVYRDVLFHGPLFRGIAEIAGCADAGIAARLEAAPAPARWITAPVRDAWIADPLALDAAFQLMILWSVERHQAPCLPCYAASFRQYRERFPSEGVMVQVQVTALKGNQAIADFAFLDLDGDLVAEVRGAECTLDPNLAEPFRRNTLQPPVQS